MRKLFAGLLVAALVGCGEPLSVAPGECKNTLTAEEASDGWRLLFDGVSLDQWRNYGEDSVEGWGARGGCLAWLSSEGDLVTREQFGDFELKLEWRISEGGNSGIFIRGDESGRSIHHTAMEMQVLDNEGHWDGRDPTHRAGAYYDMIAPPFDTTQPVGVWNEVHIIARGAQVEFRLNGRTTAAFEQMSPAWESLYEQSKFTDRPRYGRLLRGHIGLQDHWNPVLYRNIRIRELE